MHTVKKGKYFSNLRTEKNKQIKGYVIDENLEKNNDIALSKHFVLSISFLYAFLFTLSE